MRPGKSRRLEREAPAGLWSLGHGSLSCSLDRLPPGETVHETEEVKVCAVDGLLLRGEAGGWCHGVGFGYLKYRHQPHGVLEGSTTVEDWPL